MKKTDDDRLTEEEARKHFADLLDELANDHKLTEEEVRKHFAVLLNDLTNRFYSPEMLDEMLARGNGEEIRRFLTWYHKFVTKKWKVPAHWLLFTSNLSMDSINLTQSNSKAREGLLAKQMNIKGRRTIRTIELRDASICITVWQYRNSGIKLEEAIDKTLTRLEESGLVLSHEGVKQVLKKRDQRRDSRVAEEYPNLDFIKIARFRYDSDYNID